MRDGLRAVVFVLFALCLAAPASAQESGVRLSGNFAGVFGEGHTNIETGGAVGYRFTPRVGIDFKTLVLPDLELGDGSGDGGRAVAFLASFVAEFPATRWLIPYVEGGGGVANVSQSSSIGTPLPRGTGRGIFDRGRQGMDVERISGTAERRRAETDLALTVGGGVDFRIWRGLAVGVNLSYLSLMGNLQDRNLTQIGTRASYRF